MKKTIGIAGWSGSGKTTLVENLIKIFKNKYKLKVCTLKHAHKNFEIDKKGDIFIIIDERDAALWKLSNK